MENPNFTHFVKRSTFHSSKNKLNKMYERLFLLHKKGNKKNLIF